MIMVNEEMAMEPEQMPAEEQAPEPQQPSIGVPQQAAPEEQAQYDEFVSQAFNLIYDQKMLPQVLGLLQGEGDPIEGLARAASMIISRVISSAGDSGIEMTGDVLFHGGTAIFEDLANLSEEAGIHDFSQDPDGLEGAYFRALDYIRMEMQESGKLDTEAAQRDMAALQEMDASGALEEMLARLAEGDAAPEGEPAPEEQMPQRRGLMNQEVA